MTKQVLILNHKGGIVFQGDARLFNFERDPESGCKIADCKIEGQTILVWKIDGKWQGWL